MTRRNPLPMALFTALFAAARPAPAQQVPPVETGPPTVTLKHVDTGAGFQLLDADDGTMILDGSTNRIFEFQDPGVEFSTVLQEQPTGVDLIIIATNPTDSTRKLGSFMLATFLLGQQIKYRDFRGAGRAVDADYLTYVGQAYVYPQSMYSPVWVMSNSRYAVGVSFLYPVLTSRHEVRIGMGSPQHDDRPESSRGWLLEMRIAGRPNDGPKGRIDHPATLAAGESRAYVISVRIAKNPDDWIRTLTPYRAFFRDSYGGVKYERDPRPVLPVVLSVPANISQDNPNGFTYPTSRRPDVYGWKPWVDALTPQAAKWGRFMLWAPSGVYGSDATLNYPYQFTSRWLDDPQSAGAPDPKSGLPALARAGELGLWWGNSARVAPRWNPTATDIHPFDPDNPSDVQAAFRELDLASRAGATRIGLDSFAHSYCPAWKLQYWLSMMKSRYPKLRFVMETAASDLLHNEAPIYLSANSEGEPNGPADLYTVTTPHYLADFLNPGHEIWLAYNYKYQQQYGIGVNPTLVEADARRFASWGYVPVMSEEYTPGPETLAVESWRNTVPNNLQQSVRWNAIAVPYRIGRGPDGQLTILTGQDLPPPPPAAPPGPDSLLASPAPAVPTWEPVAVAQPAEPPPDQPKPGAGAPATTAPAASPTAPAASSTPPPPATGRRLGSSPIGPADTTPVDPGISTDRSGPRSSPKPLPSRNNTKQASRSKSAPPSRSGKGGATRSVRSSGPTIPAGVSADVLRKMIDEATRRATEGIPPESEEP